MKTTPPLIPGVQLSIDQRRKFWVVLEDLACNGSVEPRDRDPDRYPLHAYRVAERVGWATVDSDASHLTYRITSKGHSVVKEKTKDEQGFQALGS